jgi:hypothetical protein
MYFSKRIDKFARSNESLVSIQRVANLRIRKGPNRSYQSNTDESMCFS